MSVNKRLKVSHTGGSVEEPSTMSISNLPNDLLKHCFSFVPGSYITVAPVSKQFHRNYCTQGMYDSLTALTTEVLLKIGNNRRTTVDAVSDDIKLTEYCFINNAPEEFMIKVCHEAALKGRTDILECADIFGIDLIKVRDEGLLFDRLIDKFAKEGNLEMIQYFDRRNLLEDFDDSSWTTIFELASESEHLHLMKWIFQEKMHLIEDSDDKTHIRSTIEAYEHVVGGVTAPEVTYELYEIASRKGNIEALEYCHRSNYQFDINDTILCNSSMENEDKEQALVTLKWLRQHDYPWGESLCSFAVSNDNIEALKWARNEGCHWSDTTLSSAAQSGNIAMIEYCLGNECPMNVWVCASAMRNKNENVALEVLKLLHEYSCPWSDSTCISAIVNGHFEAMKWAKDSGCPWSVAAFYTLVKFGESLSIIEEILQDEPRHDVNKTFEHVLCNRSSCSSQIIEKLKLLHAYGYEWNTNTTLEAAKQGRLQVLQALRFMGCPLDKDSCIAAVRYKNIDVLEYLQRD